MENGMKLGVAEFLDQPPAHRKELIGSRLSLKGIRRDLRAGRGADGWSLEWIVTLQLGQWSRRNGL